MTIAVRATDEPESQARLRAELDHRMAVTPAMLHSIDERGRLVSVSDAWLAKLGYTRDEVLGAHLPIFSRPPRANTR
jgi:PAS domain S-box-containing protein